MTYKLRWAVQELEEWRYLNVEGLASSELIQYDPFVSGAHLNLCGSDGGPVNFARVGLSISTAGVTIKYCEVPSPQRVRVEYGLYPLRSEALSVGLIILYDTGVQ